MRSLIKRETRLAVESTDATSVSAIFSDESVGRDGDIWLTQGIDTAAFLRNPVVPYAHNVSEPPVGRVSALTKTKNQLRGIVTFTPEDVYPFGFMIGQMYRQGYLNAFSCSIIPIESEGGPVATGARRTITRCDLLEISAVPVPALVTALVAGRSQRAFDTSPAAAWAEYQLDHQGRSASAVAALCALRKAAISPPVYHMLGDHE